MAIVHYDFSAGSDGDGTSTSTPKNTWATPSNGDIIRLRPGVPWTRGVLSLSASSLTFEPWRRSDNNIDSTDGKPTITVTFSGATSHGIIMTGTGTHTFRSLIFQDFARNSGDSLNGISFNSTGTIDVDPGASGAIEDCEFYGIPGNAVQWNGVSVAGGVAASAPVMRVLRSVFDNIGGDCVFGSAQDIEIAHNRMTRMSQLTETGDGVGLLHLNPVRCWIHHNYIDHRDTDFKHCVIVDGIDGSGHALVEDNELLGVGTVGVNLDQCKGTVRRNIITTSGIGVSCNTDGNEVLSNVFFVNGYKANDDATVGMFTSDGLVDNNTFICAVKSTTAPLVGTGTGRSGNTLRNNVFKNAGIAYQRGSGSTETRACNWFENTTSPYVDSALAAIALAGSDQTGNAMLDSRGRPSRSSPLLRAGYHTGYRLGADKRMFANPPPIGAYEL